MCATIRFDNAVRVSQLVAGLSSGVRLNPAAVSGVAMQPYCGYLPLKSAKSR
ncbi:MAG: hypothetical protein MI923_06660 [Phycisphaerales bacterium]|nr:hypothetical protein [Phycisphaerales bacterium]